MRNVISRTAGAATVAVSVARLTLAACTPATLSKAFSTWATQEAQFMPAMRRLRAGAPWATGAFMASIRSKMR